MKNGIRKLAVLVSLFLCMFFSLYSQVTVGSSVPPEKAALLDIKNKDGGLGSISSTMGGLLTPRVEITDLSDLDVFPELTNVNLADDIQKKRHTGLVVYNIHTDSSKNIEEGIYVWNGERWEKSSFSPRVNFFYMPSVVVPTATTGPQPELDLYALYREQFENPKKRSPGAPLSIPFYVTANQLYYYITDFDSNVFDSSSITISADGKMNYSVLNAATDGSSYINIVFVVK